MTRLIWPTPSIAAQPRGSRGGARSTVSNFHRSPVVDMKAIAAALEKTIKAKKQKNAAEGGRGDAPPAVAVVKPGVVGSAAWTGGRYVAKDGQRC